MSKKKEMDLYEQEELRMASPEEVDVETGMNEEDQKAVEAMRKFTDEDDEDVGEFSIKSILGGDFLMSKFMLKQVMFVMFCVVLMICYTGNRYDSQQDAILIDSLRSRLQEVKYNVLTQSSELMNLTRQSNVEKMLRNAGDTLLHNSITPPYLIEADKPRKASMKKTVEEVLVDSAGQRNEETSNQEAEQPPTATDRQEGQP